MNLIQNHLLNTNNITSIQGTNKPKQEEVQNNQTKNVNVTTLPSAQPDFNVRVPIAYTKLNDIKLNEDLSAKCYRLANGQKVIIMQKDGPTVVKTYVNTGSFNEKDNIRGISHYIEHNLFNGSEALGDKVFFDEVNNMGAKTNASTSFAETNYFIASNLLEDTDLEKEIELHAGMLTSPKFLVEKLEKEKKIVNSEINMYMGEDFSIGETQTIKNLFNIKSSSLDLVAGTTDNITNLTRDDVVNYFNSNYYPANMTTVITGEVDPDETMKIVSKYFNTPNKISQERHFEKLTPIENTIRQDIISPKSEGATSIFMGFAGTENNNYKEKVLINALNVLAGGLIYSRTSPIEKKYGNKISFQTDRLSSRPQDKNILMVESQIPDDKVEDFLKDLYSVIDKLSKVPATDEELTAVKNKLIKQQNNALDSSFGLNHTLGHACINGIENEVQNFHNTVESITAEDIMNAAKKYLNLNKCALTVVHPHTATENSIKSNFDKSSNNISFTGANKKTPININAISAYKTHNNFEVILNDVKSNNVEYRFELEEKSWTPKQCAITDILSDMMRHSGSKTKTSEQIARNFDTLGVSISQDAGNYGISLSANFPVENTKKALEAFNECILDTQLTENLFKETVDRLKNNYSTVEASALDKSAKEIFKGLPLQFSAKDKLESLDKITLNDVLNFYKEILEKSQGTVVVSAPFFKHPELKQEIFNSLGAYSTVQPKDISLEKTYNPINETKVFTEVNRKNQAEIVQNYTFKQNGNLKDRVTLNILNEILGGSSSSRLFSDLRETRHLAYHVSSMIDYFDDMGVMELYIKTTTENLETGEKSYENVQKAIDGFNENIEKLKTQKVSAEELESAKKSIKTSLLSALETNRGKTSMIKAGSRSFYGVDMVNKILATIDTITAEDILNSANYVFKDKPIYSLTATQGTLEANKEYLENLKTN